MSDTPNFDRLLRRVLVRVIIDDEAGARALPTLWHNAVSWIYPLCRHGALPGITAYTGDVRLVAWHISSSLCVELLLCGPTFDEVATGEAPSAIVVRSSELSWR